MRLNSLLTEGIKVYHGSRNGHGRFVIGHTGDNSHTFGSYQSTRYGVFFSSSKQYSALYGEVEPYELSLRPKEIVDLDKGDAEYGAFTMFNRAWRNGEFPDLSTDPRFVSDTWQFFEDDLGEVFHKWLMDQGFKAAKFTEYMEDDNGRELKGTTYVLFDLHRVRRNPDPSQPDLFLK